MASRNKLSTKIIIMVEVIILISSFLFCLVSVYIARVGIRRAIQQRMLDIANCASGSVDGDFLAKFTEDDIGTPEYQELFKTLNVFKENVELKYVYSIREVSGGNFIFTLDTDPVDPAHYGGSVKYTEALAKAGKGTAAVDEVPYSDQWGEFYSAYSPVFDSKGKVAGIIAVDFSVEWFNAQLAEQTRSTVVSYAIILLFSLVVAGLLSVLTVRPFVRKQNELMEEKVRAESANLAKSDFLANMSHEIRTPINAVMGMNEMILREGRMAQEIPEDDRQAKQDALRNIVVYAGDVENAGHNLLAIVNDILDFSKIEAGRLDLVESPYQLSSLLNDLSNMILFKAQDKKLDFEIDVDQELPDELCGDEIRVRQILINLLSNAVKYTDEGSVRMSVKGQKHNDGFIDLYVNIKDTGIGIRPDDKEKLFSKFQRLDMERNSTVEGTGLGLVITKRLLDMMGGTISVESEYGKGSVFTVMIPQRIVSDTPVGDFKRRFEANLQEDKKYRESFRAPKARILIVDDTRINLAVVVNLLKNTHMQIDTANSGAEAVEMAEKTAYDIVLMDQRMPEMDGTEAFHRIRDSENGSSRNAPVICLTADAVVGAKERYLAEGFTDYLSKPVDSYSLERMLMKYLPESKLERVRDEVSTDSDAKDYHTVLRAAGVDPKTGLMYCQNDEDFYRSMLAEYAHGEKEKKESLQKSYEEENWHDYAIYVHALKSTSKMIGALMLSEQAAELEAAASADEGGTIKAEHDSMMRRYEKVTEAICSVIPANEGSSDSDGVLEFSSGDDDIMEFLPEE